MTFKRVLMFGVGAILTVMIGLAIINRVGFLSDLTAKLSGQSKAA